MRTLSASPMRTLSASLYCAIRQTATLVPRCSLRPELQSRVSHRLRALHRGRPDSPPNRGRARPAIALVAALICLRSGGRLLRRDADADRPNSGLGIRTVEWLRDHGARGLVNEVENIYYSLNAPAKGGPALKQLPAQPGTVAAARTCAPAPVHAYRPAPITPVIHPGAARRGRVARDVRRTAAPGHRCS